MTDVNDLIGWFRHAKARGFVSTQEGEVGRLIHVSPVAQRATVLIGGRRHKFTLDELTLIDVQESTSTTADAT